MDMARAKTIGSDQVQECCVVSDWRKEESFKESCNLKRIPSRTIRGRVSSGPQRFSQVQEQARSLPTIMVDKTFDGDLNLVLTCDWWSRNTEFMFSLGSRLCALVTRARSSTASYKV